MIKVRGVVVVECYNLGLIDRSVVLFCPLLSFVFLKLQKLKERAHWPSNGIFLVSLSAGENSGDSLHRCQPVTIKIHEKVGF